MKAVRSLAGLAIASVVAWVAPSAKAAILLSDDFDGYADQAAFDAAWPAVSPQPSGVLSTTQFVSPTNAIFNRSTLTTEGALAPRNQRSFAESGTPSASNVISYSYDFYDSNAAASPYRQYTTLQDSTAPSAAGQLISIGLNNNHTVGSDGGNFYMARILGYTPTFASPVSGSNPATASGAYFKLNDNPALVRSTGWHNLKVLISDADLKFYVDNQLAETVANTFTLRSYDVFRLGSGVTSAAEAYYDNVRVENGPVPEAGSLTLFAMSSLWALRRRRV
jgi:hypothetical protein